MLDNACTRWRVFWDLCTRSWSGRATTGATPLMNVWTAFVVTQTDPNNTVLIWWNKKNTIHSQQKLLSTATENRGVIQSLSWEDHGTKSIIDFFFFLNNGVFIYLWSKKTKTKHLCVKYKTLCMNTFLMTVWIGYFSVMILFSYMYERINVNITKSIK